MSLLRTFTLLIVSASVMLSACDGGPVESPSPPALLPLERGHRWIFTLSHIDADGDTVAVEPDTVSVIGDTALVGERWFLLGGTSPSSQAGFGGYYAARGDGVWFRSSTNSPAYLQYAYPAEPGTAYPYAPHRYTAEALLASTEQPLPGSDDRAGHLYTIRFDSLRAWPHHAFRAGIPPLRRLLRPGIGFVEYETQQWTPDAERKLVLHRAQVWRLVRFESG